MCSRSSVALLLVALVACDRRRSDGVAALGAPAPVTTLLGPIPGPHDDAGSPRNPYADDPSAINDGRVYYSRYNCSGCHGDHGGGGMGPSHRDTTWLYGSSDGEIFRSIADGRGKGMPAWGTKLPDAVIWKMVAYIKSMRTAGEPEPPDQSIPKAPAP